MSRRCEAGIGRGGIKVGEPLTAFRGVLTGVPEYIGVAEPLMESTGARADEGGSR